jgi:flagellar transcriptional activator FlhC
VEHAGATGIQAVMKAYKLYLEQMPPAPNEEPLLSLTRAWTLVRFFNGGMLQLAPCSKCQGKFIVNALDLNSDYLCGLCHMPSRAGKTRKAKEALDQARADEQAEQAGQQAEGLDPA